MVDVAAHVARAVRQQRFQMAGSATDVDDQAALARQPGTQRSGYDTQPRQKLNRVVDRRVLTQRQNKRWNRYSSRTILS